MYSQASAYNPTTENEKAGSSVYHRENGRYDVFIQRKASQRFVMLRFKLGSISHEEKRTAIKEGTVQLPTVSLLRKANGLTKSLAL